ncbi:ubiquitin carboxyl-hydrolase [Actinomyces oris]|uniref:ubiquitin carboxyl-hydrolase n=1 Tax=Actinomyces TaxID=1654 RepID=UPI0008070FF4|nr:ubiquitin carboxyl-hydrolase [Actinomyces oris]OBY95123.1 ubiquitin carboxyl-hydrolase [Actinomyces oris]
MASLLHRFGRGRVVASTVVVVTAGLLLAVSRMVFSHPTESAKEPGIVLTESPRVTSSQSSTTATPSRSAGGASSTQHESGGSEAGSSHSSDSSDSSAQGHAPQAVEPDPPVAVDHGHRQPAPAAPAAPAGTAAPAAPGRTEVDDDDDDKKPVRNGVKEADDDDRDDD